MNGKVKKIKKRQNKISKNSKKIQFNIIKKGFIGKSKGK